MTGVALWRVAAAGFVLLLVVAVMLIGVARRQDEITQRLRMVQGHGRATAAPRVSRYDDAVGALRRFGAMVLDTGIFSGKSTRHLEQTLAAAGYRPASALPLVVGSKVALMLSLPVIAWIMTGGLTAISSRIPLVATFGGAAIGLMLPDMIIGRLRKRYLAEVERGLPDALDLLVICADAGLPLETALDRVALEFRDSDPPTANELSLTANE